MTGRAPGSLAQFTAPPGAERRGRSGIQHKGITMSDGVLVSIVDDDPSVLESLPDLVRTFGFASRAFASAEAFLTSELLEETKCLILDVAMPEMSGPELWREL